MAPALALEGYHRQGLGPALSNVGLRVQGPLGPKP